MKETMEVVFEKNLGLLKSVAQKMYQERYNHCKAQFIDYEDFVQIGSIGLMKAIENFDESKGFKFSTYAVPMIRGEIRRYMRDKASLVKVPRIDYAKSEDELATINSIIYRNCLNSLDEIIHEGDNNSLTLESKIGKDDHAEDIVTFLDLKKAMDVLDSRERTCIYESFFNEKSQKEIAELINRSQVQVSRIISGAIEKMRSSMELNFLREVI